MLRSLKHGSEMTFNDNNQRHYLSHTRSAEHRSYALSRENSQEKVATPLIRVYPRSLIRYNIVNQACDDPMIQWSLHGRGTDCPRIDSFNFRASLWFTCGRDKVYTRKSL
jgi:hypothetical protein